MDVNTVSRWLMIGDLPIFDRVKLSFLSGIARFAFLQSAPIKEQNLNPSFFSNISKIFSFKRIRTCALGKFPTLSFRLISPKPLNFAYTLSESDFRYFHTSH